MHARISSNIATSIAKLNKSYDDLVKLQAQAATTKDEALLKTYTGSSLCLEVPGTYSCSLISLSPLGTFKALI